MKDNKAILHELIGGISNDGTLEYLATFVSLFLQKWGN